MILHLSLVCFDQTSGSLEDSWDNVEAVCNQKFTTINSISEFELFMKHYHHVIDTGTKPKRGILNLEKNMRKCFDLKDQLYALEALVSERHNGVCKMSFINKMINYHVNYMTKGSPISTQVDANQIEAATKNSSLRWSFDGYFFLLFAHQVSLTCKSKLVERLTQAQAKYDCSEVVNNLIPQQLTNEDDMKLTAESFIRQFKRVEDYAPLVMQSKSDEPYFQVIISKNAMEKIDRLKELCRSREPYYKALFYPISLLAMLGYNVDEVLEDSNDMENDGVKVTKCWLATAQLCQGILRTHLDASQGDTVSEDDIIEMGEKKLVEVKFGHAPDDVNLIDVSQNIDNEFVDTFDEFSGPVLQLVKKKKSIKAKIKRKALIWARNFVERHVDLESKRKKVLNQFVDELTRDVDSSDSAVAFAGKKSDHGMFLPGRIITDDADTIVQAGSFFVHKGLALIISSVVAITLSAVFVWFAIYSAVASCLQRQAPDINGNFKDSWRQSYDKRMQNLQDKVERKGWKQKLMVYRGSN